MRISKKHHPRREGTASVRPEGLIKDKEGSVGGEAKTR